MSHRAQMFVLFATIILSLARPTGQAGATKTLNGFITIKTSGGVTAVLGKKDAASNMGEFLFCIDLAQTPPPKIEFTGPARVVYRPQPLTGIPAGITISGPESVSSTLAVVPDSGKAWLFVAKGEKALLPPGDPGLANATTVNVSIVRRLDWTNGNGPRRGVDVEGCLAPAC
jgi:hypothetical protein